MADTSLKLWGFGRWPWFGFFHCDAVRSFSKFSLLWWPPSMCIPHLYRYKTIKFLSDMPWGSELWLVYTFLRECGKRWNFRGNWPVQNYCEQILTKTTLPLWRLLLSFQKRLSQRNKMNEIKMTTSKLLSSFELQMCSQFAKDRNFMLWRAMRGKRLGTNNDQIWLWAFPIRELFNRHGGARWLRFEFFHRRRQNSAKIGFWRGKRRQKKIH